MSWLDTVIIIVLVIAAFLGLKTGLIKAVLSLAGLIIGVVVAGRCYVTFAGWLSFIDNENTAKIAAFAIIVIGIMIIAAILAHFLKWAVSAMLLGWVNHLGGAIFGLALGAIFCAALLAIWTKWLGAGSTITSSAVAALLLDKFPLILGLLPDEFNSVRSFF